MSCRDSRRSSDSAALDPARSHPLHWYESALVKESHDHASPVRIGLIGAGRIGTHHATTLARGLTEAGSSLSPTRSSPRPDGWARRWGSRGSRTARRSSTTPRVEAVAITCASTAHADLVVAAAAAGKAVFGEKPMAMTLADADRAIDAAEAAGVALQVGFNRRFDRDFAAAHDVVTAGGIGTPSCCAR